MNNNNSDDDEEEDEEDEAMNGGGDRSKAVPIVDVLRALLRALDRTARTHPA